MRTRPTWRIPAGVLALVAGLALYAALVAWLAAPVLARWPVWAQCAAYLVLGTAWLLPLRPLLVWMETGRISRPPHP